ncbi:hypothetical protein E2542_SST13765 [Spatholobus suberectus]|nr:hypothetical protein E2542_SST13765 [Spatholobus suberectus]
MVTFIINILFFVLHFDSVKVNNAGIPGAHWDGEALAAAFVVFTMVLVYYERTLGGYSPLNMVYSILNVRIQILDNLVKGLKSLPLVPTSVGVSN